MSTGEFGADFVAQCARRRKTPRGRLHSYEQSGAVQINQLRGLHVDVAAHFLHHFYSDICEELSNMVFEATLYFITEDPERRYLLVGGDEELGYTYVTANFGVLHSDSPVDDAFVKDTLDTNLTDLAKYGPVCVALHPTKTFGYMLSREHRLLVVGQGKVAHTAVVAGESADAEPEALLVDAVVRHLGYFPPPPTLQTDDTFLAQSAFLFDAYTEPMILTCDVTGARSRGWVDFIAVALALGIDHSSPRDIQMFAPYRRKLTPESLADWINDSLKSTKVSPSRVLTLINRIAMHQPTPIVDIDFTPTTLKRYQQQKDATRMDTRVLREDIVKNYAGHLAHLLCITEELAEFVESVLNVTLEVCATITDEDTPHHYGLFNSFMKVVRVLADMRVLTRQTDGRVYTYAEISPYIGGRNISLEFITHDQEWWQVLDMVVKQDRFLKMSPSLLHIKRPEVTAPVELLLPTPPPPVSPPVEPASAHNVSNVLTFEDILNQPDLSDISESEDEA